MHSSEKSSPELGSSERIGNYEVVRKLGQGGMAETFECIRRRPGGFAKRVALKRVLAHLATQEHFREEFLLEARLLARLDHAGIIDAYDYDEDDAGRWYLVMELVDGLDLARLLRHFRAAERRMPPSLVAYVGAEVAEALHYLHNLVDDDGSPSNIVHRDVSPSNILISRSGDVKLADFGIATFAGRPKFTETQATKGKDWYLSPEHLEKGRGLEGRSDLFSLGAVLYEALTDTRPFECDTRIASHHAILMGKFPPLLSLAPHLEPELARVIESLLSPDKNARPATGRELALLLRTLAPHATPKTALAQSVCEGLPEVSADNIGSDMHFTGDPLAKAQVLAAAFRPPPSRALGPLRTTSTESAIASVSPPAPATARPPARGLRLRRAQLIVAAALVAALTTGIVLWFQRPDPTGASSPTPAVAAAPSPNPASKPQAVSSTTTEAPPAAPTAASPAADEAPAPLAESASTDTSPVNGKATWGTLRITLNGWGYVWVDGINKGRAPVQMRLEPGVHELGASYDKVRPKVVRQIRIAPGKAVEQALDLPN